MTDGSLNMALRRLAAVLATGAWSADAIADRLTRALEPGVLDPAAHAARLLTLLPGTTSPPRAKLMAALREDPQLKRFLIRRQHKPFQVGLLLDAPVMAPPVAALAAVRVPQIATLADLARWLDLRQVDLDWFADAQDRQHHQGPGPLAHYRYRWLPRKGRPPRLLEIPKPRLKRVQRKILDEILVEVPCHEAAHGFRRGRSCRSFVEPHLGRAAVLRLDLADFFPSIGMGRVLGLFRSLGYPAGVAAALARICTHRTSEPWLREGSGLEFRDLQRLRTRHLPQGAPSSPALANLVAYRLDCRLAGLARRFDLAYSRYADDLAFSGGRNLAHHAGRIEALVGAIALEEGLLLNHRKTRLMTAGGQQRLTGVVVNRHPNIPRVDYDRLKALLYNCVRFGPEGQNRAGVEDFRAHLAGRIAHVSSLNLDRGERLLRMFEQIKWV